MHNNFIVAYSDLRRALVAPDDMPTNQLYRLLDRVYLAREKYPDDASTPAQNAMNKVLAEYAGYIEATLRERV